MSVITRNNFTNLDNLSLTDSLGLQFTGRTAVPADADLAAGRLFYNSTAGALQFYNGVSWTSLISTGGSLPSWETIFGADNVMALTTAAWSITQAGNFGNLILTKDGTGAGVPLVINNAGTGDDISIINTEAGAEGVVLKMYHNGATPADNDVVTSLEFVGNSDTGIEREYGALKLLADDVSNATEDASYAFYTMVGGTSRKVLSFTSALMLVGYGASATISSQGAYDLVLETNSGSSSGTITIANGAAGAIALAPDTTGVVTVSTGIQVGGTTPTACTFATAGTTGNSFYVTTATITSGDVVRINHSNAGTLSGGKLLNLTVASSTVFSVGEGGDITMVGTAGSNALAIANGDVALADGSITLVDADNAASLSVTNDTATTASVAVLVGAGTFTGSTTTSFFTVTPSGLTTGTAMYMPLAALTTGKGLHITSGATVTTGSLLYVQDTGANNAITSGNIATFDSTATAVTGTVNRIGNAVLVSGSRTVTTGTVSDNYNDLSVTREEIINGAGAFTATGALVNVANTITNTSGTITDTTVGVKVTMAALGTGAGISVTHSAVAGSCLVATNNALTTGQTVSLVHTTSVITTGSVLKVSSTGVDTGTGQGTLVDLVSSGAAAAVVAKLTTAALDTGTMFSMVGNALTTGKGLSITSSSTGVTSGSLIYVTTATTGAVATNGVVSITASADHTSTSNCGIVHLSDATTQGTAMDIAIASATTGVGLYVASSGTGITSGSLIRATSGTTGAVATNGIVSIRATGAYTSTSNAGLLDVGASATTGGTVVNVNGATLTDGYALYVQGAAAYTGTGFVTVIPSGLTSGVGVLVSTAALTTGIALSVTSGTAMTSGSLAKFYDNSTNTGARSLVYIHSDSATANMAVAPLTIRNDSKTTTNFTKLSTYSDSSVVLTLWMSDETDPNGALTGTAGDICYNGPSNKPYYCTGTTNWTTIV